MFQLIEDVVSHREPNVTKLFLLQTEMSRTRSMNQIKYLISKVIKRESLIKQNLTFAAWLHEWLIYILLYHVGFKPYFK